MLFSPPTTWSSERREIKLWIEDRMHTQISNRVSNWFPFLANNILLTMRCIKMNHELSSTKNCIYCCLSRETAWLIDGNFVAPTTKQNNKNWTYVWKKVLTASAEVAYFFLCYWVCCAMCWNDYRHQQFIPS